MAAPFEKFIDEHQVLKEYFEEFPKQVMLLAHEGKVAKISNRLIVINMNHLHHFLASPESPFDIETIEDFLESMHITGFSRTANAEKSESNHLCYSFFNPLCVPGEVIEDGLYKKTVDFESKAPKGSKHLTTKSIGLVQRLLRLKTKKELKMTKLQLAQLRLKFELQKQIDSQRKVQPVIEFSTEETDYNGGDIAGYYGNVTKEELTKAFQNFLPFYGAGDDQASVSESPIKIEPMEVVVETVETKPEPKKPRKYTKKSRDAAKESEDAVMSLRNEVLAMES